MYQKVIKARARGASNGWDRELTVTFGMNVPVGFFTGAPGMQYRAIQGRPAELEC